jgi:hypothetical protein
MFSTPTFRKIARLALTTVAAGAGAAFLFLGAPADAEVLVRAASRGV